MNISSIGGKKKLRKGGDSVHVQTVRCCLTQHPIYMLNPNLSIYLVKHCMFKKIYSCDPWRLDSWHPN